MAQSDLYFIIWPHLTNITLYFTVVTLFLVILTVSQCTQCEYILQLWFLFCVIVIITHNVTLNLATVFVSNNYDFVTHIATLYLTLWQSLFCFWQFCLTVYHNWEIVSLCDTVFWWKYLTLLLNVSQLTYFFFLEANLFYGCTLNKIINATLLFWPPFYMSWTQRSKTFSMYTKGLFLSNIVHKSV